MIEKVSNNAGVSPAADLTQKAASNPKGCQTPFADLMADELSTSNLASVFLGGQSDLRSAPSVGRAATVASTAVAPGTAQAATMASTATAAAATGASAPLPSSNNPLSFSSYLSGEPNEAADLSASQDPAMFSTVANQLSDNENAALNEYLSDPNSAHNLVPSQPETLAAYEASGADATQIAAFAAAQGDA